MGQLRKGDEDQNPYMEPRLWVMERFWYLLNLSDREGHTYPKGSDGR